ncbi:hypothetical protein V2J09_013954 [Rumex salicifolius]
MGDSYIAENGNLTNFVIPNDVNGHKIKEEDEETLSKRALQITRGISFPMVLRSAIQLNVLEILSEGGRSGGGYLSAAEVAAEIPGCVNPHAPALLDRMLCLLSSFSILKCKLKLIRRGCENGEMKEGHERVFTAAPICKYFLTNSNNNNNVGGEGSFGPLFLLHHDNVFFESWKHLNDAVLEGGNPFQRAYGMKCFEYMGIDPKFNHTFNRAMSNHTTFLMTKILDVYRGFEGLGVLVDVGGGTGATLNLITSRYPDVRGINFDLPYVLADAPTTNPRVESVGGDMFDRVPNGDAIFMKWILHDWSDDDCLKVLKNCWKALPEKGKVIIVESIFPLKPENNYESQIALEQDVAMMAHNPGGKERTGEEFEFFAVQSGFSGCHVICSVYNSYVIEFHK